MKRQRKTYEKTSDSQWLILFEHNPISRRNSLLPRKYDRILRATIFVFHIHLRLSLEKDILYLFNILNVSFNTFLCIQII